jgi:O-antigen/teichoic acid export membrane protein
MPPYPIKDRGHERTIRASLSSIVCLVNRGINISAGLISIPLTAKYLGTERFGMWLVLSSFLAWVSVADLGLANSLTNALATADAKEDRVQSKKIIATAFGLMISVTLVASVLLSILYPLIRWDKIFNIKSSQAISESNLAASIGIMIFLLRLTLSLPKRIYDAFQEGYIYEFFSIFGNLLSFATLVLAIHLQAGLPFLLGLFFGISSLGDLLAGIYMFCWKRPWLIPSIHDFNLLNARWLLKTGSLMWLSQISALVMFQTDLIIVAQLFGASEVSSYGVILKLFSVNSTIAYAFLLPLWGAYSEALARGDISWIIKTFKRSIHINLLLSLPLCILIYVLCPWIISSWLSQSAIPDNNLILAMLVTSIVTVVAHSIGILVVGLCEVSLAAKVSVIQGLSNILLSIILGNIIGVAGVAWSSAICLMIFSIGITGYKMTKIIRIIAHHQKLSTDSIA